MNSVVLTEQEWQQVMNLIALAPWRDANPLLMKIGNQLRMQTEQNQQQPSAPQTGNGPSKEVRHGD